MKCFQTLPEGYKEKQKLDLKAKDQLIIVNGLSIAIAVVMAVVAAIFVPINTLFPEGVTQELTLKLLIIAVSTFAYIILHEAVHGIAMKCFGAKKVSFGFKNMYAFAGCNEYFSKSSYITIALAPVVVWLIVLCVVNAIVPIGYFWVVYIVQVINVSGAAGDIYVTIKFLKLKKDVVIQDTGTEMIVFEKEKEL